MQVVISFDTELLWGAMSAEKRRVLAADPSRGRDPIRFLLEELDRYDVPVTWAIVGHLLLRECSEDAHTALPSGDESDPHTGVERDPLYYMPDVLDWIEDADADHEVAGHSFRHPSFCDLTRAEARSELRAMCEVFEERGYSLDSMVHPYVDLDHLDLLSEFGLSAYSLGHRAGARTLRDGILPFLVRDETFWSAPPVEPRVDEYGLVAIPRSRSLRDERWGWLNVRRVKKALRDGDGTVHLTLHPHNLLYDPHLRSTFPRILEAIDELRDAGEVSVLTFRDVAAQLR